MTHVSRRALWLLAASLPLTGVLMAAALIQLYTLEPPCFVQQWRASEPVSGQQAVWRFGVPRWDALAWLFVGFGICVLLAWVASSRRHRDDPPQ